MGKSPAKWVKNMLLGKKPSKSYTSKKAADEKNTLVPAQLSSRESNATSTMSNTVPYTKTDKVNSEVEQDRSISASFENDIPVAANGVCSELSTIGFKLSNEAENLGLRETTTELQTTLRGFTACQTYDSLRGLIRVQALVRGHLVRRQALATLHCVRGIVKLQAVVRSRRVRRSDTGLEQEADVTEPNRLSSSIIQGKHSSNVFASKILASSISALPLNIQYNPNEPNSASKWLERWSSSNFWRSAAHIRKGLCSNSQQQGNQTVGAESGTSGAKEHDVRRPSAVNAGNSLLLSTLEHGKPKRNNRKPLSQQIESVLDCPGNELERVKQSLRKISLNNKETPGKSEPVVELTKQNTRKVYAPSTTDSRSKSKGATEMLSQSTRHISNSEALDVKDSVLSDSTADENNPSSTQLQKPKIETEPESLVVHEPVDLSHEDLSAEPFTGEDSIDVGKSSLMNEEQVSKDEKFVENNYKLRRRSVPANQEFSDNASQNARTLPSYMAATESAKAKLRGLGLPNFAQEEEEGTVIRRHSLPSSTNGKLFSTSPRIQKMVAHANGKYRTRSNRSLTSSKDGQGKVLRPDWRR